MITAGGSKQQELFVLTLKKKVLHFSSHHPLHRRLPAIGRRPQAFSPACTLWGGEKGGCQTGVSSLHLFSGTIHSDSGLTLGWRDVVTGVQDSCLGRDIHGTLRPEIFFFCAVVGIIINELNICNHEIVGRLERFTQMTSPQNTAFFFCQKE